MQLLSADRQAGGSCQAHYFTAAHLPKPNHAMLLKTASMLQLWLTAAHQHSVIQPNLTQPSAGSWLRTGYPAACTTGRTCARQPAARPRRHTPTVAAP
jgi:hypothetical protein